MIKLEYAIIGAIFPLFILTYCSNKMIDELHNEINNLNNKKICECYQSYKYNVTVTMYNPISGQTDSSPNITADGTKINIWKASDYRYVALSRDLLSRWGGPFEYGDYIIIEGTGERDGVYQVRDTMNPKWTNRVDILTTNSRFKYDNVVMYKYVEEYETAEKL